MRTDVLVSDAIDRRVLCGTAVGFVAATILDLPSIAEGAAESPTILEARPGSLRLVPAAETAVWSYGGQVPGPMLRVKKGTSVAVRLINKLPQPTTITWHGVRNRDAMDGVAGLTQKAVPPGESFDYRFTPPDSGLFWYHPDAWPHAAEQKGRGLYGVLIVDEDQPPQVERDLLIVFDDWRLDVTGAIDQDFRDPKPGALVTVNGKPQAATERFRPGARLRLRLVNACSDRIGIVGFVNLAPMVIGIDGQPSELFAPVRATLPIGPGSRFDIIVDLPREPGAQASLILRGDGEPDRPLLMMTTEGIPSPTLPPIAKLPPNPLLPTRIPLERSTRKEIVLDGPHPAPTAGKPGAPIWRWTINGAGSDGFSGKPLFTVARGGVVTLTFVNKSVVAQQMHIHGHVWRLLHDLDDGWDPYWRDSVLLAPGKSKHVAFVADNPGKWAIGSSMLDRLSSGMATWFAVT